MRAARGFTLFELLVVMALLAVATLLATGGAQPMARAARERGWIDRLQAELIRARSRARASGRVSIVSFVPEQQEIRFEIGSSTSALPLPAGFAFEAGMDGAPGAAEPAPIRTLLFFPDGTASDLELRLTGGTGRTTHLRVIGATGKIERLPQEPEAGAEPPA